MKYRQQLFTGERALFFGRDLELLDCTFADGESPLKESENIALTGCMFKWKYPLWYAKHIRMDRSTLFETARAGIWYTEDIDIKDCLIEAPKTFRRSKNIVLERVSMPNAAETLWNCKGVRMKEVAARGDYFGMNSEEVTIDGLQLVGNYAFDGGRNLTVKNARLITKDAFWNAENVTVKDSFIAGEYLGWNSKNLTFENCTIESLQGMCYIENLVLKNCKLLNTTLSFEYATVDADVRGKIDSVLNPSGGVIRAEQIETLEIDPKRVDPSKTKIILSPKGDGNV